MVLTRKDLVITRKYGVLTRKDLVITRKYGVFNEKISRFNEKRSRYNDIIEWKNIMCGQYYLTTLGGGGVFLISKIKTV